MRPAAEDLRALALTLGADVPVCLAGHPALVAGIGEDIAPAPPLPAVLDGSRQPGDGGGNSGRVQAAAGAVFATPRRCRAPPADVEALARLLAERGNDLAAAAAALAPVMGTVLAELDPLPGALLSRMSGSGATCFALFATRADAERGARRLRRARPGWWIESAPLARA